MRRLLLATLTLVSSAATAQYAVSLKFPDKTVELCTSPGFVVDYLSLNINVIDCGQDTIFIGDFGG